MIYVFADYELDSDARELRRGGTAIPLTPKVYHVLAYLIEHHERLVLKDELLNQVWPGTFVDDSAVKRCVAAARRAIGDSPSSPQHIKTSRGQGYRFIAPVTAHDRPALKTASAAGGIPPTRLPQEFGPPETGGTALPTTEGSRLCGVCQHTNTLMARFCVACGAPLVTTCGHCAQTVTLPATFCLACGQRLPTVAALAPETAVPPAVAERKVVTVLCGTFTRTPTLDGIPLDDLHNLMQVVYDAIFAAVQRYAGTLQYVTGDGFLALFGAPVAQEDHARRAVLAACGLQQRLEERQGGWSQPIMEVISIRMALHTGLVTVSRLGTEAGQVMVVGEGTTLAMAIARHAAPGTILASAATVRLLQGEVATATVPPLQLEHSATPVVVMQIVPRLSPGGRLPATVTPTRSPFVGRETEIAILRGRYTRVVQGQGQVVSIMGEPGMGKSRLLQEFHQELTAAQTAYLPGNCQSYGSAIPYLPLRDLVRACCQIDETDSLAETTRKVALELATVALQPETWSPFLLQLLGLGNVLEEAEGYRPEVLKLRIFEALQRLILQRSQRQPQVIAIENMQWIDATSEAYITTLVERLAGAPILLLLTFRPGYQPTWLDKSYATQIALQPLGRPESQTMMRTVLRQKPLTAALEDQLLSKAQGNPFFLEELLQTVLEQPDQPLALTVPGTIQAVIAARMDRLAPAAKALLQAAAVVGTEVPLSLLRAIAGLTDSTLHDRLRHLQTVEFLYETRFEPEPTYAFKHILTHEVAYGSLLQERRQRLHRQIVEAMESLYVDRLTPVDSLAQHALHGALWDKAHQYFCRAGTQAMARSASREAVLCFEHGMEALRHLPGGREVDEQRIDLYLLLHHALLRLGEHQRCLEVLRQATTLAEALDDARRLGWISSYMSTDCLLMGDAEAATTAGQRALALAMVCEDQALQVDAQLHLGQAYHAVSEYRRAMEMLRHNVPLSDITHDMHSAAWLVWCLAEIGDFTDGIRYGREAIQGAEQLNHPYALVAIYGAVGLLYLRQGVLDQAIPLLERSLELCRSADILLMLPSIAAHMGAAYTLHGRLTDAMPLLEFAVTQATAQQLMVHHVLHLIALSEAKLLAGQGEVARTLARRALHMAQSRKERGHEAYALRLLGAIAAAQVLHQEHAAVTFYQQALTLAQALGMRPLVAHCHLGLGLCYSRNGQMAQARSALMLAHDLFQSMAMTFWLPQVDTALAQMR